jgi:hypothetical protein
MGEKSDTICINLDVKTKKNINKLEMENAVHHFTQRLLGKECHIPDYLMGAVITINGESITLEMV